LQAIPLAAAWRLITNSKRYPKIQRTLITVFVFMTSGLESDSEVAETDSNDHDDGKDTEERRNAAAAVKARVADKYQGGGCERPPTSTVRSSWSSRAGVIFIFEVNNIGV
jgi:hypothetical protein